MRLFYKGYDGGDKSTVTGYWLIELKSLFSICVLRFNKGTRENFHNHAFNALTWFIKGDLVEERLVDSNKLYRKYRRSLIPKLTRRNNMHRVIANETSYCVSIRGPWSKQWNEYNEHNKEMITLESGRRIVKVTS